jgi:adenine-specific DNA-methyltransferase
MTQAYGKLKELLRELFQFDRDDLDFGIYRIMNQKRAEVSKFLDQDLLPQVKEAFSEYRAGEAAQVRDELARIEKTLGDAGVTAESSPKYLALKERLAETSDLAALENEVYSDLYTFFRRYYKNGDFISLRRYKPGVYAVPYEGEEVKLHWANADQYYVKTAENFRNYRFELEGVGYVNFDLVAAATERDNNKPTNGKERRFVLREEDPVEEVDGELRVYFEYRPHPGKQEDLRDQARDVIFENVSGEWKTGLAEPKPTQSNKKRTLLEKHLAEYTARNTFDYFIHKDLGGFLRRELDFFLKSEVLHIDDLDTENERRVEQYLSKLKVIKRIGHKIIAFLAQIEDFQKKLFLKKKFVVRSDYCLTLDNVPEELYEEIAANDAQYAEWERLFAISEIPANLENGGSQRSTEWLKANKYLVLDTKFFDQDFKDRLLSSIEDLDEKTDGLLINSENFQALNLLQDRYREQVKCVYIDPPYNSKTTEILYKNTYKHSSWLSLMDNRLALSKQLAAVDGSHIVAIDENEQEVLGRLLSVHFEGYEKICVTVVHNKKGIQGDYFSYNHDFAYFCIPPALPETNGTPVPESEWEYDNLRKWGRESERETAKNCFYPIFVEDGQIVGFGDVCDENFHPGQANVPCDQHGHRVAVYPVDAKGTERKWRYARNSVEKIESLLRVHTTSSGEVQIQKAKAEKPIKTVWDDSRYIAGDYGTKWLTNLGVKVEENLYPKSIHTVRDSIFAVSDQNALVADYFAGSGTTGHAVVDLNREDGGRRKYILVEMGEYFDTVLKPRIQKAIYSKDWKNGKPVSREGTSHIFKYMTLESYEDTLNNLSLKRTDVQDDLIESDPALREEYMLSYMLDFETKGSPSLLNLDAFEDPFSYKLNVSRDDETRPENVDLVETFNYLLGLTVSRTYFNDGYRVVEGTNPAGERVLVIWRNTKEKSNDDLDAFFEKRSYAGAGFDRVYANGDNTLALKAGDSRVHLIEEEFRRLMFETEGH